MGLKAFNSSGSQNADKALNNKNILSHRISYDQYGNS